MKTIEEVGGNAKKLALALAICDAWWVKTRRETVLTARDEQTIQEALTIARQEGWIPNMSVMCECCKIKPAKCRGRYEDPNSPLMYACEDCCGCGNEDGWCHPISQPHGRFLCSEAHPMPPKAEGLWEHTNAHEVGDQLDGYPGGDIIRMKCDDCGHTWTEELPQ